MRYTAIAGGEERLIEVTPRENGYRVLIDGRELALDAVHLQGFAVSLIAGTRSYRCDIDPGKNGQVRVLVGETIHPLEILDERKLRMRRAGGKFSLEGPQRIDAPMPGKVTRVLVKVGDAVEEGQGLIVVEAMKMENELRCIAGGRVKAVHAVAGQAVEKGALLVEIE